MKVLSSSQRLNKMQEGYTLLDSRCLLSVPLRFYLCLCSRSIINWYRHKLGANGHSTRHTGPVSADLQLRLVSGWGLERRSAPCGSWRTLSFSFFIGSGKKSRLFAPSCKSNWAGLDQVWVTCRRRLLVFLSLAYIISIWQQNTLEQISRTILLDPRKRTRVDRSERFV